METFAPKYFSEIQLNRIPIHKASRLYPGEIAILRDSGTVQFPVIDYAHRDDYYVFLFMEKGYARMLLDFTEYECAGATVLCILPGQVHEPLEQKDICCWFLAVDAVFVSSEYKSVFEKLSFVENMPELNDDNIFDLKYCVTA
ncbi:MAG: hypothetical protein LBB73_06895, partial [Dysgonamonadaceae bacterium]|nr:hypothetical protein [Dysgonamonadaceae bacterium]